MASYLTPTQANVYFGERLHDDVWQSASVSEQTKALAMATKAVDRLPLRGTKKETAQALQFPRCYGTWWHGRAYPGNCESAVPQAVLDAVCEEALALLDRGNSNRAKLQREGVSSFSLGGLSETYAEGAGYGCFLSREAHRLISPYLARTALVV